MDSAAAAGTGRPGTPARYTTTEFFFRFNACYKAVSRHTCFFSPPLSCGAVLHGKLERSAAFKLATKLLQFLQVVAIHVGPTLVEVPYECNSYSLESIFIINIRVVSNADAR